MAKFSRVQKLTQEERRNLLTFFCDALTSIKNKDEAAAFLADLLGPQELDMLAKRLEIAKLLISGKTYEEIRNILKVSHNTIARINAWLTVSGKGFRTIIERAKRKEKKDDPSSYSLFEKYDPYSIRNIKRRYSMYFLPELIIEEIIKQSNTRERKKLDAILYSIEGKRELFQEVDGRFKDQFASIKNRVHDTKGRKQG